MVLFIITKDNRKVEYLTGPDEIKYYRPYIQEIEQRGDRAELRETRKGALLYRSQ